MPKKPKIISRETIAQTRLFRVESMNIQFSNGAHRNYERLTRNQSSGAVLIVPFLDSETG